MGNIFNKWNWSGKTEQIISTDNVIKLYLEDIHWVKGKIEICQTPKCKKHEELSIYKKIYISILKKK